MLTITVTELKNNLAKYLDMMATQEIAITKNGKYIGSLVPPKNEKLDEFFDKFAGSLNELDFENSDDPRILGILGKQQYQI